LIGITTYREQARWGAWDVPAILLPASYADAVAGSGGEPVLLPTGAVTADVVARLDGLILAGGADVDPARYGSEPAPNTVPRPERDAVELAGLQAALTRDLPLLAICRGMQLLNVALGGDLVQHLADVPGAGSHQLAPGLFA
jgi:anthranilate synthase component 2/putative glutamine amidotransferase